MRAAVVAMLAGAAAASPLAERDVPGNDGWVTDLAGLLDAPQEQELEALLDSTGHGSGPDLALLTVPDLQGEPIESFALRVSRAWKLGSVETNDGALLVVSRDDRALRIEVGRGLEGSLTDALCARIIRNVITPRFQSGDFAGGLRLGLAAMQAAANGESPALPEPATAHSHASPLWALIPFVLFLVILILVLRRRRGGPRGRSRGSIGPLLVLAESLRRSSRNSGSGGGFGSGFGGGGFGGFGGGGGGGSFGGFGGGGGFSGGGASGRW